MAFFATHREILFFQIVSQIQIPSQIFQILPNCQNHIFVLFSDNEHFTPQSHLRDCGRFSKVLHCSSGLSGSYQFIDDAESCILEAVVPFEYAGNLMYIQGPMANTVHNFWAMVQVKHVQLQEREYQVSEGKRDNLLTLVITSRNATSTLL